jgi:hypothetical protein
VIKGLLWLVGGTVAFWALVTVLTLQLWGESSVLFSTTAALMCLVPTALTLAWTRWAYKAQPEQQLLAVFGGTAVRMVMVIAVGMVLFLNVKEFEYQRFWLFIIVFYLFTLALEMVLIVRGTAAQEAQQKN